MRRISRSITRAGVWGALYRRKAVEDGTNADRIVRCLWVGRAGGRLAGGGIPGAELRFSRTEFDLIVNDRGIAPNTPESYAAAIPEIEAALRQILGHGNFSLGRHDRERRNRLGVTVKTAQPFGPP